MSFKLKTYVGEFVWNIKDKKPITFTKEAVEDAKGNVISEKAEIDLLNEIVSLTISGEEISYLCNHFKNVPITVFEAVNHNVTYRGWWATFIYENL
jgi:hypothetical protein